MNLTGEENTFSNIQNECLDEMCVEKVSRVM